MKKIFYTFLLVCPLLFISSCKEDDVHGCFDSNATNYNENATIDNNSCCYDCYYTNENNIEVLLGNYCGNEVYQIEADGIDEFEPVYINGLPQFDAETGQQVYQWYNFSVDCW